MLDIALVHGWLLDLQDDKTVSAIGSYVVWFLLLTEFTGVSR